MSDLASLSGYLTGILKMAPRYESKIDTLVCQCLIELRFTYEIAQQIELVFDHVLGLKALNERKLVRNNLIHKLFDC